MLKEVMAENCGLCPIYGTKRVHIKYIGKNFANCSKKTQFLHVTCALCRHPPPCIIQI